MSEMKDISKREELLNKLTRVGPAEVAFVECFLLCACDESVC